MTDRYPGTQSPAQEKRIRAIEERLRAAEQGRVKSEAQSLKRIIVSEKNIETTTDELTAHVAANDPHPQYVTHGEGDAAYEPLGAVASHEAASDPHPQYLTQVEGDSLYSSGGGFDDSDLDGGDADQHFIGLLADGGDADDPLTDGVADGGVASTVHGPGGPGGSTLMTQEAYDADADGIVDKAESLNDGTKSATAAAVADHLASTANPHGTTAAQVGAAPSIHKSQHAAGGSDVLSPADIGAATSGHTHSIDDLTDVDTTTTPPVTDEVLKWNGTKWVPGAGGGGGSSVSILSSVATAQALSANPMPTANTVIPDLQVTVPASAVARTVLVSFMLNMDAAQHVLIGMDGTKVYPNVNADFFGGNNEISDSWTGVNYQAAGIPVSVPGDNVAHTIEVMGNAEGSTAQRTYYNRYISVLVVE